MTALVVICALTLVGQIALLAALHGASTSILAIERRLAELERAGILIQPDGKHDQALVMSRREKIRLAERFARDRSKRPAASGQGA